VGGPRRLAKPILPAIEGLYKRRTPIVARLFRFCYESCRFSCFEDVSFFDVLTSFMGKLLQGISLLEIGQQSGGNAGPHPLLSP